MADKKIRGGSLIARALKDKGIEHVFTLSGGFCNPALEGFMECQMEVINCPHEQIAGHIADGHTRITRKPAVCLVGPEGFANAVPSMMEAWGKLPEVTQAAMNVQDNVKVLTDAINAVNTSFQSLCILNK